MTLLVFFLEEPSAKEMLKGLLPRILADDVYCQYVVFEGKQDLEKRLPMRLRAWQIPDSLFVVLRDKDSGNCLEIKQGLVQKCINAGKPDTLVRIACHELESWYLGDLQAVETGIGSVGLAKKQNNRKYRTPDLLANPAQELANIAPNYQKVSGSQLIGLQLNSKKNRSTSFNFFISGIHRLLNQQ